MGKPLVQRHSSAKSFEAAPNNYTASSAGGSDSAPSTPAVTPALDASPVDPVCRLASSFPADFALMKLRLLPLIRLT